MGIESISINTAEHLNKVRKHCKTTQRTSLSNGAVSSWKGSKYPLAFVVASRIKSKLKCKKQRSRLQHCKNFKLLGSRWDIRIKEIRIKEATIGPWGLPKRGSSD